jgi:trans-2,3-dihydro-3-hydroxyanthranilate isomerase
MSKLSFVTYDVFTDVRFAGNPLAVVFGADHLSDAQMQAIAREFNLSETVFLRAPANAAHAAEARIFTPGKELPFAGHPTVGAAIALAEAQFGRSEAGDHLLVLEEKIGPVRCAVSITREGASFAEFSAPKLSQHMGDGASAAGAAAAIGLDAADIGFGRHKPALYSAGVTFAMIPVASVEALGRAHPPRVSTAESLGATEVFVYARAGKDEAHSFRARMFAPDLGIAEDPATGAAAAAFAGVLAACEDLPEGWSTLPILQGVEMGRPSLIGLEVNIENGALAGARIAGKAVKVSEGTLYV